MKSDKMNLGCGFLLGLFLFGGSAAIAVLRGGTWYIGLPLTAFGSLFFAFLSYKFGDVFWTTLANLFKKY